MRWWSQDEGGDHRKVVEEKRFPSRTERPIRSSRPPPSGFIFCICYWFLKSDVSELYYQVPAAEVKISYRILNRSYKSLAALLLHYGKYITKPSLSRYFISVHKEQQIQTIYTCYRTERRLGLSVSLTLSIPLVWPGLACLCSLYSFNEEFKCISA